MEFAVIDHLDAASSRPLSPEGIGRLSEVANDVHDARPANNQEGVGRIMGRVTKHLPPHEVASPGAPFVQTSAKRGHGFFR